MKRALKAIGFGIIVLSMFGGAIGHIVTPDAYAPLVPSFIPLSFANWTSFVAELGVGILLVMPRTRAWGGLAFMALMMAFFPIHVWDLTKDEPFVGSHIGATIRLLIQCVLIWGGWAIFKAHRASI
jgi:uncharacterized membrane protein